MASLAGIWSGKRSAALETWSARWLAHVAARPGLAALVLVALVLALDLAGNLLLPPLDRTEVIYAQTAKQMLEADGPGTWTAPAFQAEPRFEKPLAVLWLQAASAWVTGQVDQIRGYRIPSILGTILAVLFTYWGARRLFDARVAFVGAALLATMLVITVQATLAMPEALMLAMTCAALFALARAYVTRDDADATGGTAFIFWTALGLSVLVNVVTVPLIALLTALALIAWDRGNARWLKRLVSLPGILVFLVLAALWPLALWMGGTLDTAIAQWQAEGLHLLLGPQEMKWRVLPGLFVVFLLLGMFPAGLFLGPAIITAWRERTTPAIRFLVAWIMPYLLFLELFTRKTPLYMVQAMLPPLAVLFAVWVMRGVSQTTHGVTTPATTPSAQANTSIAADAAMHEQRWFRLGTLGWLALVVGLVLALWVLPFLLKMWVSPLAVLLGLATLALGFMATKAMLSGHRLAAASSLVAMAVAFNNLTIPVTFAGLRPVWVSSEIRAAVDALRRCSSFNVDLIGHTEPSVVFELGTGTWRHTSAMKPVSMPHKPPELKPILPVVSEGHLKTATRSRPSPERALACIAAYDFIQGCSLRLTVDASQLQQSVFETKFKDCPLPARFACENVPETPMVGRMCK